MDHIITWAAPIAAALLTCAGQLWPDPATYTYVED